MAQRITKRKATQDKGDRRQFLCVHGINECVVGQRLLVIIYRRQQSAYWTEKYLPLEEYFEEATNSRLLPWVTVDLYDQRSGVASRDLHEWTAGGSWLDGIKSGDSPCLTDGARLLDVLFGRTQSNLRTSTNTVTGIKTSWIPPALTTSGITCTEMKYDFRFHAGKLATLSAIHHTACTCPGHP